MNTTTLQTSAKRIYRAIVPETVRASRHSLRTRVREWRWNLAKRNKSYLYKYIEPDVKMRLYTDSVLCRMIYFWEFEAEIRKFLKSILCPGDIFLDVGANVGLFSLIAARCVGTTGQVHAFEPVKKTFQRLTDNVDVNRLVNVTCHRLALSDTDGEAVMTIATDGYDAWNSLGKPYMGHALSNETTPTQTLDHFVEQQALFDKIKVIKVDVEGWEAYVLAGGVKTLSSVNAPLIIIEFTEEAAALANSSCTAVYNTLKQLGYELFQLNERGDLQRLQFLSTFPNINVIAAKNITNFNFSLS